MILRPVFWLLIIVFTLQWVSFNPGGNWMSSAILLGSEGLLDSGYPVISADIRLSTYDIAWSSTHESTVSGLPPGASYLALPVFPIMRLLRFVFPKLRAIEFRREVIADEISSEFKPNTNWLFIQDGFEKFREAGPVVARLANEQCLSSIFAVLLITTPLLLLFTYLCYQLARRQKLSTPAAFSCALICVLGSQFFPQTVVYSKDFLATALTFFSLLLVFSSPRTRLPVHAGVLLGLAYACDYKVLFVFISLLISLTLLSRTAFALRFLAGFLPMLVLVAVYHRWLFGSFFTTCYSHRVGQEYFGHGGMFLGFDALTLHKLFQGLFGLFSGVFVFSPLLLIMFVWTGAKAWVFFCSSRKPFSPTRFSLMIGFIATFIFITAIVSSSPTVLTFSGGVIGVGGRHFVILTAFIPFLLPHLIRELLESKSALNRLLAPGLIGVFSYSLFLSMLSANFGAQNYPDLNVGRHCAVGDWRVLEINTVRQMAESISIQF